MAREKLCDCVHQASWNYSWFFFNLNVLKVQLSCHAVLPSDHFRKVLLNSSSIHCSSVVPSGRTRGIDRNTGCTVQTAGSTGFGCTDDGAWAQATQRLQNLLLGEAGKLLGVSWAPCWGWPCWGSGWRAVFPARLLYAFSDQVASHSC